MGTKRLRLQGEFPSDDGYVKYNSPQELSAEQQAQVKENLGIKELSTEEMVDEVLNALPTWQGGEY